MQNPTKFIRVITDSTNHVLAAQKQSIKIGWQLYRCEPSKDTPHVKQGFKCPNNGNSASTQFNNALNQNKMPSVLIVVDRTRLCIKDFPRFKTQLLKQQSENMIQLLSSSKKQPEILHPTSIVSEINMTASKKTNND